MLSEEELRDAALLVFANKQDQPGAKGAGEISEALKLAELRDRNWSIVACSAIDGRGVDEGMDWLTVSFGFIQVRMLQYCKRLTDSGLADDDPGRQCIDVAHTSFKIEPPQTRRSDSTLTLSRNPRNPSNSVLRKPYAQLSHKVLFLIPA